MAENLSLYIKETCPFCKKVMVYLNKFNLDIPTVDVNVEENAQKLIEIGGKKQVPCLVIDGKPLYESDDIIAYIKENLV